MGLWCLSVRVQGLSDRGSPLPQERPMSGLQHQAAIEAILQRLRQVGWREREEVKQELLQAALSEPNRTSVTEFLQLSLKELSLELRWEVEEVLEALVPPPDEPDEPDELDEPEEPEQGPGDGQLRMSDLDVVYDDPRGLMVYKHKTADRWFAVQPDPRTGQPQMFELHPTEVQQLKAQLKGSPYWVLGAGVE